MLFFANKSKEYKTVVKCIRDILIKIQEDYNYSIVDIHEKQSFPIFCY
jgi:hypothetical protein